MTRRLFAQQRHETEGFVYRKRCFHRVILWRWWVIAKVFLVSQMTATTTRGRKETPTVAGTCDGDAAFVLCLSICLSVCGGCESLQPGSAESPRWKTHFPNKTFSPWERLTWAGELLIGLHRALTVAAARPDVNAAGYSLKQKRNTTAFRLRAGGPGGLGWGLGGVGRWWLVEKFPTNQNRQTWRFIY